MAFVGELGLDGTLLHVPGMLSLADIRPDDVACEGARRDGGIAWAAPSQVVIDCLAGTGRMPSEGEALIDWMQDNEDLWRYPSIQAALAGRSGRRDPLDAECVDAGIDTVASHEVETQ